MDEQQLRNKSPEIYAIKGYIQYHNDSKVYKVNMTSNFFIEKEIDVESNSFNYEHSGKEYTKKEYYY